MNEQEAIAKMIAPAGHRPSKPYRGGVIQVWVTRACDKACFGCTQGSNLGGKPAMMTPEQFGQAVESLRGYYGVVGVFGGNPAMHPQFEELCSVLRKSWVPKDQRGLWSNNPLGKGKAMRETFNPSVSNLNVHLDRGAYDEFKRDWPECGPVGLTTDSRHSPPFVSMRDVLKVDCVECQGYGKMSVRHEGGLWDRNVPCQACSGTGKVYDEARAWNLISDCDINKHWSAMVGMFRDQLRAWFCEVAGAQSMLHQDDQSYPDTGQPLLGEDGSYWWTWPMSVFTDQVRKHCHECGIPLRSHGELAQSKDGTEQTSHDHADVFRPKTKGRNVQVVTDLQQLGIGRIARVTDYLGNSKR